MKRQFLSAVAASWALAAGMASAADDCVRVDYSSYDQGAAYSYGESAAYPYSDRAGYAYGEGPGHSVMAPNYCPEDECDRYACCIERFYTGLRAAFKRCALRKYKRAQHLHRGLLYPECPPYCSPTFGYHPTRWRPFPQECEYVWSNEPAEMMWQPQEMVPLSPMPATPAPNFSAPIESAPASPEPYFPPPPPPPMSSSTETAPDVPPGETIPFAPPAELSATPRGDGFRPSRRVQAIFNLESPAQVRIN